MFDLTLDQITDAIVATPAAPKRGPRNGYGSALKVGAVTYPSLAAFARACAKKNGLDYMTVYMRLRSGKTPQAVMARPARGYRKVGKQLELML